MNEYRFYKYLDENSILVINKEGELSRLKCPFIVVNKNKQRFLVEQVAGDDGGCLFYRIKGIYKAFWDYRIPA